ncbi:MAG: hypothetical protein A2600_02745 [Candidatus Lambdaproteobacteria bacterium RIFOXYD1_FULL_56_27]|uniref:DUF3606 domain-containing protein n=1 Tax=Candidatus Lambdaproteobacteria bacterium RIFOXYD2_FULL_56_26 TaxID=1817773 RepID=A0A1F6H2T2_9PROT|nr:MAG: hypothetical protein A2557_06810 [Candidatus Lambdaproteobacteria bacterium RIFOXYD2_FULL_56_26]OGH05316.1 MAG: hypothetical protein A2426_05135 [Candidatus Lambdaproteobacteria bacterium RIFOXYC1_FULL_56_13]OGH09157.1 MAG: hypothetical protein A2600_02745 [Candidatus Lambdaproteobacteria bacterium RIFOXYD1_FULL_56_27]
MRRPDDQKRIDPYSYDDLRRWAEQFKVSLADIREALETVGSLAADVYDFLRCHNRIKVQC